MVNDRALLYRLTGDGVVCWMRGPDQVGPARTLGVRAFLELREDMFDLGLYSRPAQADEAPLPADWYDGEFPQPRRA